MINIDQDIIESCTLDTEEHIRSALGEPIRLTDRLQDKLSESYMRGCGGDILNFIEAREGRAYELATDGNSFNSETDLSVAFRFTVYLPEGSSDWIWTRGAYVVIEVSKGGDPRGAYHDAQIYHYEGCLGDSGLLSWQLDWWAFPVRNEPVLHEDKDLAAVNEHLFTGYSSYPLAEIGKLCSTSPVWSDKFQGWICRFDSVDFLTKVVPLEPSYGI